MIVECDLQNNVPQPRAIKCATPNRGLTFEEFKRGAKNMENENLHFQLQNDLIQHLAKLHSIKNPFQLQMFVSVHVFVSISSHHYIFSCAFLLLPIYHGA